MCNENRMCFSTVHTGTSFKKCTDQHIYRSGLKTIYTNIDCLTKSKKSELEIMISTDKPDIVAITEIFPKNSAFDNMMEFYKMEGYETFIPDLNSGRGLVIYFRKQLNALVKVLDDQYRESVWCELILKGSDKLIIGCVYRSPNSPVDDIVSLNRTLNEVVMKGYHTF